jgi:nicotinamidase-related amidase
MREFEDYCWRELVDDELRSIYAPYVRERAVGAAPGLVVVHPGAPVAGGWYEAAATLIREARRRKLPVVHSGGALAALIDNEPVCARPCESAFFSSDLERALKRRGARSLIVCGAPTSGALRATAVEGKSYGYKVAIAEETVGDESGFLHKMALFDLAHKYADVMSLDELLALL